MAYSRQADYRLHPALRYRPPRGYCRWCLNRPVDLMGRWDTTALFCCRDCADLYRLHTTPALMRRFVYDRDLGCCTACGARHPFNGDYQIDHERPLFLAFDDWDFYAAENQRILCTKPCHLNKTAQDRLLMKPARVARRKQRRKGLQL